MFKKILSFSALSFSALLLILSVIDIFVDAAMFEWIPLKIAMVLMLALSLTVTIVACIIRVWRRPLLLLACLLQTPLAGGVTVVWVYGLCFPEVMPLQALFPFLVALASLATVIQTVVVIVGEGMYEPLDLTESSHKEQDEDWNEEEDDDFFAYADELSVDEEEEIDVPTKAPARSATATSAAAKPKTVAAPGKAQLTEDDLDFAQDDLAPIPKRKRDAADDLWEEESYYPTAPKQEKPKKDEFADPFVLLKEEAEFDQWKNSVKGIFDEKKDGE